jgi:hypothetical protein
MCHSALAWCIAWFEQTNLKLSRLPSYGAMGVHRMRQTFCELNAAVKCVCLEGFRHRNSRARIQRSPIRKSCSCPFENLKEKFPPWLNGKEGSSTGCGGKERLGEKQLFLLCQLTFTVDDLAVSSKHFDTWDASGEQEAGWTVPDRQLWLWTCLLFNKLIT